MGQSSGNVYAQPLYIEGGPDGPMIIVVTASNNVYALNATTGTVIWQRTDIGPPVTSGLPCGNINPFGIIGTPVVDLASRSAVLRCMITTPQPTFKHFDFFLERGHRRHHSRLAGGSECHRSITAFVFFGTERARCTRSLVNGIVCRPTPARLATAAVIMAGLSAWTSIILLMCMAGRQQRLAAEFGDTVEWRVMAPTCM